MLIDRAGFRAAFAVLAALPLLSLWVAALVPHETPANSAQTERRPAWDLLATPALRRLLLVNWFMSASWDVHSFLVPVLGHERGFSASAIGSVLGVFALAVTSVRLVLPVLAHRLGETEVLRGAMMLVAAVFTVYPWASTVWWMSACAICLGCALGCSQPMIMTTLHQITPSTRHGEAIALRSMAINGSSVLMPIGFGALGAVIGASGVFWLMAGLVSFGSVIARKLDPAASHAAE